MSRQHGVSACHKSMTDTAPRCSRPPTDGVGQADSVVVGGGAVGRAGGARPRPGYSRGSPRPPRLNNMAAKASAPHFEPPPSDHRSIDSIDCEREAQPTMTLDVRFARLLSFFTTLVPLEKRVVAIFINIDGDLFYLFFFGASSSHARRCQQANTDAHLITPI